MQGGGGPYTDFDLISSDDEDANATLPGRQTEGEGVAKDSEVSVLASIYSRRM